MPKYLLWVWWVAMGLLVLGLVLGGGALVLNRLPWAASPGPIPRLGIYLSRNRVQTRDDHSLPELRSPHISEPPDKALAKVAMAMGALGWEDIRVGHSDVRAVAVTPLLGFADDLAVTAEPSPGGGSRLSIRSASRVGRADFGANLRHVMDLMAQLDPEPSGRE